MPLDLITPRTLQVATAAEAKLHARIDGTAEDALIESLIIAATDDAEAHMQRSVLPQTWRLTLDGFPQYCHGRTPIELQRPTVTAVTSITYVDENGDDQVLDPAAYQLAAAGLTARVVPAYGTTWPVTRQQLEALRVDFVSGWVDAASVPALVKAWVLMRVKDLYDNRGAWTEGKKIEVNRYVDFMLDRYLAKSF